MPRRALTVSAVARLSPKQRSRALALLGLAAGGQLGAFLALERRMRRTGGPGIIPFELAGTPERARAMLDTWGEEGRSAARRSLLLDYLFPPTYAALQGLACDAAAEGLARRDRGALAEAGRLIAWTQPAATAFDYVENSALLMVLGGRERRMPGLARRAALAKFALIYLAYGYLLLAGIEAALARRAR